MALGRSAEEAPFRVVEEVGCDCPHLESGSSPREECPLQDETVRTWCYGSRLDEAPGLVLPLVSFLKEWVYALGW